MAAAKLKDPRECGPKPPFPQQAIAAPGKERAMNPPADHGESGYHSAGRLEGRVAVITGGDSGIGRAVALLYAQEGAKLVINALPEDAEDTAHTLALITERGGEALAVPGDISDPLFCKHLVGRTVERFGTLDILVNNAAYQRSYQNLDDIPAQEIQTTFQTNVFPLFYLTQAALPHLRPGACVINTSSIQALSPTPGLLFYAASKAAISSNEKPGRTAGRARHPRQCGGAGAGLDAADPLDPGSRRRQEVRFSHLVQATRPARRTSDDLRLSGFRRCQLRHRRSLRRHGRTDTVVTPASPGEHHAFT